MEVLEIVEQEDGSALVSMDMTEQDKMFFVQQGFTSIITEGMKKDLGDGYVQIDDQNYETISFTYDTDKGWLGAIEILCKKLNSEERGDDQYSIPLEDLIELIKYRWPPLATV